MSNDETRAPRRFRHKKRGTEYVLIGVGHAQGELHDDDSVVLYRGDDGGLWVRHQVEFCDGRFEEIATPPAADVSDVAGLRPIDMLLFCPQCGIQHIDEPDERTPDWSNPPHRSHLCHGCGCIWRPADVPTNGVVRIATVGKADTWGESNSAALAHNPAPEQFDHIGGAFAGEGSPFGEPTPIAEHLAVANAEPIRGAVGEAEPFGYWIEQRGAEPVLLRKPAYIPEPSSLRTVTPLYSARDAAGVDGGASEGEVERLRHVIDRDRYVAAIVLNNLKRLFSGYDWLRGPSRGSFAYDDEHYQLEFGLALDAFEASLAPLARLAWDKSDCTRDPNKVVAAQIAGRERAAELAGTADPAQAVCTCPPIAPQPGDRSVHHAAAPIAQHEGEEA